MKLSKEKTEYLVVRTYYSPYPTAAIVSIDKQLIEALTEGGKIMCQLAVLKHQPFVCYSGVGEIYYLDKDALKQAHLQEWFNSKEEFTYLEGTEKNISKFLEKYAVFSISEITELHVNSSSSFYFKTNILVNEDDETNELYITEQIEFDVVVDESNEKADLKTGQPL